MDARKLFGGKECDHERLESPVDGMVHASCHLNDRWLDKHPRMGLLWIGEMHYPTKEDFVREAMAIGLQAVIDWADSCLTRRRRRHLMGRRRCMMEGSFADSANNHGYKRARWRSRVRVEMQNLLIAAAQNLRKLIWAFSCGKRKSATMAADLSARISIMLTQRLFRALCQPIKLVRRSYNTKNGQKLSPTESLCLN